MTATVDEANDKIRITPVGEATLSPAPPLSRDILGPVEAVSAQMWPGVPVIPTMLVATTDGRYLNTGVPPRTGKEFTALLRDGQGNGVTGTPMTLVVERPDGVEFRRSVVPDQGAGGRSLTLPLNSAVPTPSRPPLSHLSGARSAKRAHRF